ncbi:uncharacterized protein LOC141768044 isoform X2 [Sebastes fasciatus]|uniref:uncharacterized protein LOC141768044 isoform X2 n=1 Tax=Sebastes fasciatus TaxID=394691 RepID=UPI003D9F1666
MARNEEKQQGKLNRLWLQKEREEGRLKDVHERRPKLQSQLFHYPERKIAEFQLHMEALEREYKRFITKLRVLDPACKHKPWTPRAYCKRRADTQDSPSIVKQSRPCESHGGSSQLSGGENDLTSNCHKTSAPARQGPFSRFQTPVPTNPNSETSEAACADQDQDQPLSFDHMRLAVAAAAFRGPPVQQGSSQTQSLARVLQSGLPNLVNASLRQTLSTQSRDDDGATVGTVVVQRCKLDCEVAERIPGKSSNTGTTEERTGHVLGLDCYSSSDEECDT